MVATFFLLGFSISFASLLIIILPRLRDRIKEIKYIDGTGEHKLYRKQEGSSVKYAIIFLGGVGAISVLACSLFQTKLMPEEYAYYINSFLSKLSVFIRVWLISQRYLTNKLVLLHEGCCIWGVALVVLKVLLYLGMFHLSYYIGIGISYFN